MEKFAPAFSDPTRVSNLNVFTLVLWLGCLLIGVLGFLLPYDRPQPLKIAPPPVKVEMLNVELRSEPQPAAVPPPQTVVPVDAQEQPNIPQPTPVAEPSPAIAFALPVTGPVRIVDVRHAAPARNSTAPAVAASPAPQKLVFGLGEGRQPAPAYPARAQNEGQQGDVTIRLTVAADGRVITAQVEIPSPWSLLNDSALNTVRERWKFPTGAVRVYDVVIHFELN